MPNPIPSVCHFGTVRGVPKRLPVSLLGGVAVDGEDAVALHFADPVGAGVEVGHVETPGALGQCFLLAALTLQSHQTNGFLNAEAVHGRGPEG